MVLYQVVAVMFERVRELPFYLWVLLSIVFVFEFQRAKNECIRNYDLRDYVKKLGQSSVAIQNCDDIFQHVAVDQWTNDYVHIWPVETPHWCRPRIVSL